MTSEKEQIAKQLMESFLQSRNRSNLMHNQRGTGQRLSEVMVLYFIGLNAKDHSLGMMVSEISDKLNVTSPTVSHHINRLEEQGLVERCVDPGDRRVVRVRLTGDGESYVHRIKEERLRMFVGLVEHLGEEKSQLFAETMNEAMEYLRKQQEIYAAHRNGVEDQ